MQTYLSDPLTDNSQGGKQCFVHRVRYTPNWPEINSFYTSAHTTALDFILFE